MSRDITPIILAEQGSHLQSVVANLLERLAGAHVTAGLIGLQSAIGFVNKELTTLNAELDAIARRVAARFPQEEASEEGEVSEASPTE